MSVASFVLKCLEEQADLLKQQIVQARILASATPGNEVDGTSSSSKDSKPEKKKKQVRDPNMPKKPLTAYQLYFMETQGPYKQARPDMTQREIMV